MAIRHLFAGLPVAQLDDALAWYERLLGRPPDLTPHEGERVWQLGAAGWIYVVRDPERAGKGLVTALVDDLDALLAEVAARGITAGRLEEEPGKFRRSVIADPAGNLLTFAQVPDSPGGG